MYVANGAATRAHWEVRWAVRKRGKTRWVVKKCGQDFSEALRVYELAKDGGRLAVTLRCANMAFPPPDKYADPKYIIVTRKVKGKTKRFKQRDGILIPREYSHKMHEVNLSGMWWCPYCIKFRKFAKMNRHGNAVMACPVCQVSHEMATVRKYNPVAISIGIMRRTRSDKGTRRA